jgi:hypothetical protein
MKILKNLSGIFVAMVFMTLFGCGGGGGSTPPPTKAKLTLLSQSAAAGTKIRGIEVTVELPAGVTVKATPSAINPAKLETDAGVVVLSGATVADPAAFGQLKPIGVYTPATATTPGTVFISLAAQADFNPGEYVTVNADIAAGTIPVATGFKLTGFTAVDLNGAVISGVTSSIVPAFN